MNTRRKFPFAILPITRNRSFAWCLVGPLLIGLSLNGQTVDSQLTGTVTDPSGAVLTNARITAIQKETGVEYQATANAVGQYRVLHLPVGTYDVTATAPNFVDSRVEGVELQLNRTMTVDFSLMLPTQTTTVQVRQSLAPIDAASAQLQVNFQTRVLTDVPSAANGSGIYNLSLLGAGVASPGGLGIGVGPSVAGQRPTGNRYYVEGSDNNSYFAPGPLGYISNEVVGEVTLLQNHFSAEFGGASGGIFNAVLKSGGNQLHGGLYEYMQNRDLNSIDAQFAGTGSPRFDANRFGGSLSGPIVKNKIFYFADFEYNPVGRATTVGNPVSAPTQAGYQMLDGLSGIRKTNLQVLEKYLAPAPTATGAATVLGNAIPIGPVSIIGPSYSNGRYAAGSLDWNVSDRDQVRGRYIFSGFDGIDPNSASTLPAFYANSPSNTHFVSLSEFHTFSATLQNELRSTYSHLNGRRIAPDGLSFPGLDSFPTLTFVDLGGLQLGPNASVPNGQVQGSLQLTDGVVKTIGRHSITVGYDFRDVILATSSVSNPRGLYNYASLSRFLQDLSPDGATSSRTQGTGGPLVGGIPAGFLQNAAYVQDSFRVRANLTLDLGVRYEYVTVPVVSRAQSLSSIADVPGVLTFRAPSSSTNDWSPRVGFAYSPMGSSQWVIRGGFSRSFDMPYSNIAVNTLPAFYGGTTTINPNVATPNFLANGGALAPALPTDPASARAGITGYNPDQNRGYAINYTLGVQRLLGRDYTVEARYIGSRGVHLYVQDQLSRYSVVTATQNIPTFFNTPTPAQLASLTTTLGDLFALPAANTDPWGALGFTNTITSYEPRGNSQYHGLALQVTKRYSKNLSLLGAYTWSHAMDDSTATVNTTALTPRRPQDFQDMRAEWASSMLDRRHRLTITPIIDITPFSRRNWILKNLVGNWSTAFTYTYESPEYATVQSGVDANLNGDSTPDRAIVNPSGIWNIGTDVRPIDRNGNTVSTSSTAVAAYVAKNPNARYVVARWGALADAGRNTFPLDPINNIDMSIRKIFQIGEGKRLELGAQFYNLLNHPQFTPGYIDDVYVNKAMNRNFLLPNNANFGQYQKYFSSNARWTQIVGRFTF